MRKMFVTLMATLASCSAAFAFWPEAAESSLEIGAGYRNDSLRLRSHHEDCGCGNDSDDFNNFGVNGFQNENQRDLRFRDISIWEIDVRGKYVTCDDIYLRGYFDYGWVTDGKLRNHQNESGGSDDFGFGNNFCPAGGCDNGCGFGGNNFNRLKTKNGHVYDGSIGVGYQFRMCDDSFAVTPVVGWSWSGQHLDIRRHRQCHESGSECDFGGGCGNDFGFADEGFGSNNNRRKDHYRTRWNGPWIGVDFDYRITCEWSVFATYEFHWATFHARGSFRNLNNLNNFNGFDEVGGNAPNRFTQRSNRAYGNLAKGGVKWDFCECWTLSVWGQYQDLEARHGHERSRVMSFSNDEFCGDRLDVNSKRKLRKVTWQSASVVVDVGMVF